MSSPFAQGTQGINKTELMRAIALWVKLQQTHEGDKAKCSVM